MRFVFDLAEELAYRRGQHPRLPRPQPKITPDERRQLFDLYLRRHDRIDTWDLDDRAAPRVVCWYLLDQAPTAS